MSKGKQPSERALKVARKMFQVVEYPDSDETLPASIIVGARLTNHTISDRFVSEEVANKFVIRLIWALAHQIDIAIQETVKDERAQHESVMTALNQAMGHAELIQHPERAKHSHGYWVADCDFEPLREEWEKWSGVHE